MQGVSIVFLALLGVAAAVVIPEFNATNLQRQLKQQRFTGVLCYSETHNTSVAALKELDTVALAYLQEDDLIIAKYNFLLDKAHRVAGRKVLKCSGSTSFVVYDRQRKKANKLKESTLSSSGMLALVQSVSNVQSAPTNPPLKTLKVLTEVYDAFIGMDRLEADYFTREDRSSALDELRALLASVRAAPFGSSHIAHAETHLTVLSNIVTNDWERADVEKEIARLRKLISKTDKKRTQGFTEKLEIYRTFVEKVPNIVHFIKVDGREDHFNIVHFLCIAAAKYYLKPDRIYMHAPYNIRGPWWDRIKKHVTLKHAKLTYDLNGKPLRLAAHQSDVLRIQVLQEMGGIYMDWDVFSVRPHTDLLASPVTFGAEKKVFNYKEVLGVAVMIARKDAPFLTRFAHDMADVFDGEKCYSCHSTILGRDLALEHPEEIRVLNYTSFYHPGWELEGIQLMFDPKFYKAGEDPTRGLFYSFHLFESHENFQKYLPLITENWINTVDTHFAQYARPLLKHFK